MEISDYQSSLNLHSALVATSNFSGKFSSISFFILIKNFKLIFHLILTKIETSTFLTGIKVLIQQCQQANVRL